VSLEKVKIDLQHNKISLSDAIVKALPFLKEKESDLTMTWLSSELQGYSNPLNFYYQSDHNLPAYRVVNGLLKMMTKDGKLVHLDHALANRTRYFVSAPIAWLEESASLPGQVSVTEMPELTKDMNSGQGVVIEYSRRQLQSILQEVKVRFLALLK